MSAGIAAATRLVLSSAGAGLVAAACLWAAAGILGPREIAGPLGDGGWTDRSRPWFTAQGLHPHEIDADSGRRFTWTSGAAHLRVPHLDRRRPARAVFRVVASRPPEAGTPPTLRLLVDGVVAGTYETSNEPQELDAVIPARPSEGVTLTLDVGGDTWTPGAHDPRHLGVQVEHVRLIPADGPARPTWPVLWRLAAAASLAAAGVLLCGLRWPLSPVAWAGLPAAFAWLLTVDAAFLSRYVEALPGLSLGVLLIGALVALVRRWRPAAAGLPEWATACGLVLSLATVKLALFLHPMAIVGDGIFQVHRAQLVQAGHYFFTSITPRPFFEFPYAIALYVAAIPFWRLVEHPLDHLKLLRAIVLAADAVLGVALYAAARRQWDNRRAALLAAALWPLSRAAFQATSNANLTNVFGQTVFGIALAAVIVAGAGKRFAPWAMGVAVVSLTVAFLSHFGTVSLGVPLVLAVAATLVVFGRAHVKRLGIWTVVALVLAGGTSYAVYYSRFDHVYRKTAERVAVQEVDAAPGSSIAASPAAKFRRWITDSSDDYGLPGLPLAAAAAGGAVLLGQQRRRDALTLVVAAWVTVWVGFSALGILTPVQMRVNLATAPAFVLLGAYALGTLAGRSRAGLAAATVVAVAIALDGMRLWRVCLGL